MRFVSGSINFFPNRGSKGVNAPNCNEIWLFLQKFYTKLQEMIVYFLMMMM